VEEEGAVCYALTGVNVGGAFHQTETLELVCSRCANLGTDQHMIEFNRHKLPLSYSSYRPTDGQTYPSGFVSCKQALVFFCQPASKDVSSRCSVGKRSSIPQQCPMYGYWSNYIDECLT
jgi:hypothetical protein